MFCGVFSADLRSSEETPLCGVIVPLYWHTYEYCRCLKHLRGNIYEENLTRFISSAL